MKFINYFNREKGFLYSLLFSLLVVIGFGCAGQVPSVKDAETGGENGCGAGGKEPFHDICQSPCVPAGIGLQRPEAGAFPARCIEGHVRLCAADIPRQDQVFLFGTFHSGLRVEEKMVFMF